MSITVKKRDGRTEVLNLEKIHKVLFWATKGLKDVSVSDIEVNAQLQLIDGIETRDIHQVMIKSCVDLISTRKPDYQYVAGNLSNYLLRKDVFGDTNELPHLSEVIANNVANGMYDQGQFSADNWTEEEIDTINDFIKHERDYQFTYAGIRQMTDKYLCKDRTVKNGKLYETPQFAYACVSMILHLHEPKATRINIIRKFYNDISTFKISLPTPIVAGVRTPIRQYSSCCLISVDDSMDGIIAADSAVSAYTANRAGIGINFGNIRGLGSKIRGGEVEHTGVIPFLKKFESSVKSCQQAGLRGGGATTYMPFWHSEIESVIVLKNNKGTDDNRVRKLDYGIQLCKLFYKRVQTGGKITLFSPHEVRDLYEAFGDNETFEKLYLKYEKDTTIKRTVVDAVEFFSDICKERIETGRIYIMNIDHVNRHSPFRKSLKMSNLCVEIALATEPLKDFHDATQVTMWATPTEGNNIDDIEVYTKDKTIFKPTKEYLA